MDQNSIRQLISDKVTGIISEADDQILEQLVRDNPEVKQELLQAQREFVAFINDPHYKEGSAEANWEIINSAIKRRKARRRLIGYSAAAAIGIGIVILTKMFLPEKSRDTVVFAQNVSSHSLQIQFATGEIIDLYAQPADVIMGGLRLKIDTNAKVIAVKYAGTGGKGSNILRVPIGMNYQIILSDSSKIHLNSVSELTFPLQFSGKYREISLTGEAYMEIAPGMTPFVVNTPSGTVRVLGTAFNINTYTTGITKVSLVKGKVACIIDDQEVKLQPGKAAIMHNHAIKVEKLNEWELAWLTGRYKFDQVSPMELARLFYRLYGVEIVIDNKKKAENKHYTGTILRNETLETSMDLVRAYGIHVYYKEGKYHWY
ncbi:FecR family protein [Chitinophaga filiformis]|uniref:FecR family protein n=1 Tax=Chitinophaga filiformis TaxID=104663 RepID=A0ABY4HZX5_CHIFI|nr:FecR family protein [Chitinophaga filiformis]UPK67981.1 FecR family protein [Chitinophaga filiformis]